MCVCVVCMCVCGVCVCMGVCVCVCVVCVCVCDWFWFCVYHAVYKLYPSYRKSFIPHVFLVQGNIDLWSRMKKI